MAIQRYSSVRSFYFDPTTKGALEPYIGSWQDTAAASASASWSFNTYGRAGTVGVASPGLYYCVPGAAVQSVSANAALVFGNLFGSVQATTLTSYYSAPQNIATMIKGNSNLYASWIWRAPQCVDTTISNCDTLYFGLARNYPDTSGAYNSVANVLANSAHVSGGLGSGVFNLNATNYANTSVGTNLFALPADLEYRCTFSLDAGGNGVFQILTMAGVYVSGFSGAFQNIRGNFFLMASHNYTTGGGNYFGIRDVRVVIS
jgi:hypothetical protein